MTARLLFALLLIAHFFLLIPFSHYLAKRPLEVKLGYIPSPQLLKTTVADQGLLVAEASVIKVLFYYGTVIGKKQENMIIRPEHANMYRTLATANQLDPYNMDVYYFAQAAFTWELKRFAEVNELLERGMKYRTWDYWLPFYLGFNQAYFLKDYRKAANNMKRAADISGNPLFAKLAARYFYEAGNTELGLSFLDSMIAQSKDRTVRRTYKIRRQALLAVSMIEAACKKFQSINLRCAISVEELVHAGLLERIPTDPYGGTFYLDNLCRVRSTSKFADPKL